MVKIVNKRKVHIKFSSLNSKSKYSLLKKGVLSLIFFWQGFLIKGKVLNRLRTIDNTNRVDVDLPPVVLVGEGNQTAGHLVAAVEADHTGLHIP